MKKACPFDQNAYFPKFPAGELSAPERITLRWHHLRCAECRAEWKSLTQLRTTLQHIGTVVPPDALRERIWSHLPVNSVQPHHATDRRKRPVVRWVVAGACVLLLGTGSAISATIIQPFREQYKMMHEDPNLNGSLTAHDGSSQITARLDGLLGDDGSSGMRWRVVGRARVRVLLRESKRTLMEGQTATLSQGEDDHLRSRLSPASYARFMGVNPIADPRVMPVLTVNDNGRVEHRTGYGNFTVFEKWEFEIKPLPTN